MAMRTIWALAVASACAVAAANIQGVRVTGHEADQSQSPQDQPIMDFLKSYDAAFTAKSLERLATMYHPDVTVYEGGGINPGWADYRDRHLGPELKSFVDLQFSHENIKVQMLGAEAAYVTANYVLRRTVDGKPVTSGGLATYVLIRQSSGWVIRHSHTSATRRPAGGTALQR